MDRSLKSRDEPSKSSRSQKRLSAHNNSSFIAYMIQKALPLSYEDTRPEINTDISKLVKIFFFLMLFSILFKKKKKKKTREKK